MGIFRTIICRNSNKILDNTDNFDDHDLQNLLNSIDYYNYSMYCLIPLKMN